VYSRETVLSGADMNTSQLKRKEGERRGNLSRLPVEVAPPTWPVARLGRSLKPEPLLALGERRRRRVDRQQRGEVGGVLVIVISGHLGPSRAISGQRSAASWSLYAFDVTQTRSALSARPRATASAVAPVAPIAL